MEFSEIEKKTSYLYHVKGKTTVRDNVCDFSGEIIIKEIGELIEVNKDVDDLSIDGGIDKEGYIIAEYKLNEDSNQKGTGIFKGILISLWYTNLAGKLKY